MGVLEDLLVEAKRGVSAQILAIAEAKRTNQLLGEIMAKVQVVINLIAVKPNAPPQYTGPTTINDLVVGVGRQLIGMDADGDAITWSVDPKNAEAVSITPGGVLTALRDLGANGVPEAITIYMDDGRPDPNAAGGALVATEQPKP